MMLNTLAQNPNTFNVIAPRADIGTDRGSCSWFERPVNGNTLGDSLRIVDRGFTEYTWNGSSWVAPAPIASTDGSILIPSVEGIGIQFDVDNPNHGWCDMTSSIEVRGTGANDPTFAVYTGTTMRSYQFSAGTMQEVFSVFHVPHDYVPGTDIFFHTHWSNAAATPNTGNVVWKFDYSFAKGFGQEAFPAVQTVEVIAPSPATRYLHNVSETTAVSIPLMEVDGLILVRCYRDAANVLDTCTDAVFLHTMDIHYQSTGILTTRNKAPNFYA
jgi:hypothetical protein